MRNAATFRRADPADLDALLALLREAGLPTAGVREHREGFLVAESDGRMVACGALELRGKAALLRSIAVAPSRRGTGLGRAIVERLLAAARDRDVETLVLLTTTAAAWFPRFGFEPIARDEIPAAVRRSEEFRGACPETATAMLIRLR